jgi:hypothetical protein
MSKDKGKADMESRQEQAKQKDVTPEREKRELPLNYEVGYGKPPAHARFRKGQSGNPNGRPKGTLNLTTTAMRVFREDVVINENGQRKTVTKLEAALKQIANKSASGDLNATRFLLMLEEKIEVTLQSDNSATLRLEDVDRKVIDAMLEGFEENLVRRKQR